MITLGLDAFKPTLLGLARKDLLLILFFLGGGGFWGGFRRGRLSSLEFVISCRGTIYIPRDYQEGYCYSLLYIARFGSCRVIFTADAALDCA